MPSSTPWSRILGWFSTQKAKPHPSPPPPAHPEPAPPETPSPTSKSIRAQRREQLFGLVRENMIRAGILSSAYKFKVLTLDRQGQSFIVMIDIFSDAMKHDPQTLAELETSLQALSNERLGIEVKNLYWRILDTGTVATTASVSPQHAASNEITAEEIQALRQRNRVGRPDFAPTQPMEHIDPSFAPLSDTQPGRLE